MPLQIFPENALERDIARTVTLSRYMRAWGAPRHRTEFASGGSPIVEIYEFESEKLRRYATIGLRQFDCLGAFESRLELLMVLDAHDQKAAPPYGENFVFDVIGNLIHLSEPIGVPFVFGAVENGTRDLPCALLDEARDEPEDLGCHAIGKIQVHLAWVVPIYQAEQRLIQRSGIERFDTLVEAHKVELVRISRPSVA